MKSVHRALIFVMLASHALIAQDKKDEKPDKADYRFLPVYDAYGSKPSMLKLKDGRTIHGIKGDLDRKKGQIYSIVMKDSVTNKKTEYLADEIAEMYLLPSDLENVSKTSKAMDPGKLRTYTNNNLDQIVNRGYVYFRSQSVSLKNRKKEKDYLMQLVNPSFSVVIQVYGDNMAKETGGIGVMGMKLTGGLDKSYYVSKAGEVFWLKKSDFDDYYLQLFGDSEEFLKKYPKKKADWEDLNLYVYEYTRTVVK
jgi:hypothetical protein